MNDKNFPRAPLRFREILVDKLWGGRRMATVLGKKLPAKKLIGESWEIACRPGAVSVIAEGPLKGKTLAQVIEKWPREVLGADIAGGWRGVFPLLVKFIDATLPLSVQVHPSDEFAHNVEGEGAVGKMEAWVVMDAGPKARLLKGLIPGMTKERFAAAVEAGKSVECMNAFPMAAGDIILMPPGTIHTAEDCLFAEFQQNSDITYRIDDWGRPGANGKPRELQLDKGLAAIDYHSTGLAKCKPAEIRDNLRTYSLIKSKRGQGKAKREVLIWTNRFIIESLALSGEASFAGDPSRFYIVMAIDGSGDFRIGDRAFKWKKGQTFLMPAAAGAYTIHSRGGRLLYCYVP